MSSTSQYGQAPLHKLKAMHDSWKRCRLHAYPHLCRCGGMSVSLWLVQLTFATHRVNAVTVSAAGIDYFVNRMHHDGVAIMPTAKRNVTCHVPQAAHHPCPLDKSAYISTVIRISQAEGALSFTRDGGRGFVDDGGRPCRRRHSAVHRQEYWASVRLNEHKLKPGRYRK